METKVINVEEYKILKAYKNTVGVFLTPIKLCPVCKDIFLIKGYVCLNCGYDIDMDRE